MIIETFEDITIRLLSFAAVASLILGVITRGWADGWLDGASILVAITIMTLVSAAKCYMNEK